MRLSFGRGLGAEVWGQDILGQGKVSGIRLRIAPLRVCHGKRGEEGGGGESYFLPSRG